MPRRPRNLPTDLSLPEIRRLLAIKERMVGLEQRRNELHRELTQVDAELARLLSGSAEAPARGRPAKKARKKAGRKARRKTARKTAKKAAKKTAKKTTKKTAKKAGRKAGRKTTRKVAADGRRGKKAARRGRPAARREGAPRRTLEDVVAEVIRARGEPIPFQELLGTITKNRLFKSRSRNFANVLRRTLSTSSRIRRVGRGIYDVA